MGQKQPALDSVKKRLMLQNTSRLFFSVYFFAAGVPMAGAVSVGNALPWL